MLLDEPLANLDYKLREELRDELPKLFARPRRDLRLCHHRARRGAAARRQHRDPAGGPGHPVRPDLGGLPPARRPRHGPGLLRSADEHRRRSRSAASKLHDLRRRVNGRRAVADKLLPTATTPSASGRTTSDAAGHRQGRAAPSRAACSSPRSPVPRASFISISRADLGRRLIHGVTALPAWLRRDTSSSLMARQAFYVFAARRRGCAPPHSGGSLREPMHGQTIRTSTTLAPLLHCGESAKIAERATIALKRPVATTWRATAAPMRCSGPRAAARPRFSTSSPACCVPPRAGSCSTTAT